MPHKLSNLIFNIQLVRLTYCENIFCKYVVYKNVIVLQNQQL